MQEETKDLAAQTLNPFEATIKAYLDDFAAKDMDFKGRYENPNKSIQECCNYIYGQVQQSGRKGFTDDEVFQMARHYYQEDIKAEELKGANGKVVVNHAVELTEEEKMKLHQDAVKQFQAEELKKLKDDKKKENLEQVDVKQIEREAVEKYKADLKAKEEAKKAAKAKAEAEKKAKEEAQGKTQTSLFDFL